MKTIKFGIGIEVFCNEIIIEGNTIVAVSMVGRESPLKAVIAALVEKKTVTLKEEALALYRPGSRCAIKRNPLGDNIYQGVFYNVEERDRITTRADFFLTINALFHIPIHEAWADYLFYKSLKEGSLIKLKSYSELNPWEYYKIDFDENHLSQTIYDNINHLKKLIN